MRALKLYPQDATYFGGKCWTIRHAHSAVLKVKAHYMLWECSQLCSVWDKVFGWIRKDYRSVSQVTDLVAFIAEHANQLDLFATISWFIWGQRNKVRCNEPSVPLEKFLENAAALLRDFQSQFRAGMKVSTLRNFKWKPPEGAVVKANFDEAMFAKSDQARIGVVVRNNRGQVVAALAEKVTKPESTEVLEVLAAHKAVQFVLELGFAHSMFEGDAATVIKALADGNCSVPSFGHIVKDIESISGLLQTKSFSHVRRQGNTMAHALAQRARLSFPVLI